MQIEEEEVESESNLSGNESSTSIYGAIMNEGYHREVILILFVSSLWAMGYYSSFVWLGYFMAKSNLIGGDGIYSGN